MATAYPVHYQSMADRGFRWRSLKSAHCQEVILWQHAETQQYLVTLRMDGRVIEFTPTGNGELTVKKPDPNSATDMLAFARDHNADVNWADDDGQESMQVRAIMGISPGDVDDRIRRDYFDDDCAAKYRDATYGNNS